MNREQKRTVDNAFDDAKELVSDLIDEITGENETLKARVKELEEEVASCERKITELQESMS